MNDQHPPVRGLVAGKYEVVGLIGRGGMGTVWEGRHTSLGTRVAIKFVDQEYAESQEARSRFVTEARAAATIQSKHAIQIYDHGVTEDGRPYIVMELLVGEPLDRRIERLGRVPVIDTARILCQVCRALQRAHDAGIIHRDLKPENIFLVRSPDDDEEIAKVLDFGIAKFRGPPGGPGMSSSTKTGAVLGTPYYMSPEQARGLRNIDQRTDLWSLGVIAYKCVTGTLPFDGESVGDLLVKICTAAPPVPSHAVPGLPPQFDAWFARALERDPERRFRTAAELADMLAMATGLSQRRAVSQNGFPPYPSPGSRPAGTPMPGSGVPFSVSGGTTTPLPSGAFGTPSGRTPLPLGATSAPFTASASVAKPSRARRVGVIVAAVFGASVGALAVVKFVPSPHGTTGAAEGTSATLPLTNGTGTGAIALPPGTSAHLDPLPPPAGSVLVAPATTAGPPPSPPPPVNPPPPPVVHTTQRPPPFVVTSHPNATVAPPPPASTKPISPPPPPSAKPPAQADPGY
jgi:eukaryotic-like serine/threonine-protein kinase